MNSDAILGLLSDLYAQLTAAQQEIAALRQHIAATATESGTPPE